MTLDDHPFGGPSNTVAAESERTAERIVAVRAEIERMSQELAFAERQVNALSSAPSMDRTAVAFATGAVVGFAFPFLLIIGGALFG